MSVISLFEVHAVVLLHTTPAISVDVSPVAIVWLPSLHSDRLVSVPLHPGRLTHEVFGPTLTFVNVTPAYVRCFTQSHVPILVFLSDSAN